MTRATVLLTNGAAPYRVPVFDLVARSLDGFHVVYDDLVEEGRAWAAGPLRHPHHVWRGKRWRDVRREVGRVGCAIVSRLNPRSLAVAASVAAGGGRTVYFSDGGAVTERGVDWCRRAIHAACIPRFHGFIAGTPDVRRRLVEHLGISPARVHDSYLCPLDAFRRAPADVRFDVVLGGRDVGLKNNAFTVEVCRGLARERRLRIAVFGDVGRRTSLAPLASLDTVSVTSFGALEPGALAELFRASRVFLMPSLQEAWGLTLHEALRCGCAAISSPAVTAGPYLRPYYPTLHVRELELGLWMDSLRRLLDGERAPADAVDPYCFVDAARGIVEAATAGRS